MRSITLAEAEADLRLALDQGDAATICAAAELVDRLDRPSPPPSALGAALWYAQRGLHVFPCKAGLKAPATRKGVKDATLDTDVINRWWHAEPLANVAIATGWLVDVVDFDGPAGVRSRLDHWEEFDGEVLAKVLTPRPGGMHWYIPQVPDTKNGAHVLPGIDYRALGGYVVAPPSVLVEAPDQVAGTYRFLDATGLAALEVF